MRQLKYFLIPLIALASGKLWSQTWTPGTGLIYTEGKVGIGITAPTAFLDVKNGLQRVQFLTGSSSSGYTLQIGVNDDGVNFYNTSSNRGFNFKNAAHADLFQINQNGRVIIGSSGATANVKLDVHGSTRINGFTIASPVLGIKSSGTNKSFLVVEANSSTGRLLDMVEYDNGSYLRLYHNGTENARISAVGQSFLNGGDVGIGTASPSEDLHIHDNTFTNLLLSNSHGGKGENVVLKFLTQKSFADLSYSRHAIWFGNSDNAQSGAIKYQHKWSYQESDFMSFHTKGQEQLRIDQNGRVGIGTTSPEANLQVGKSTSNGMIFLGGGKGYSGIGSTRSDGGLVLGKNIYARYEDQTDNGLGRVAINSNYGFSGIKLGHNGEIDFFGVNGNVTADAIANSTQNIRMKIATNGNVGIGTTNPGAYKLAVEGKIGARSFRVTTHPWADYVFAPSYSLMPLAEVESFIQENQHLPNIPSAKEVQENGFDLEDMDAKLLEKIEELTLYVIQQQKELEKQNNLILEQNLKIQQLQQNQTK